MTRTALTLTLFAGLSLWASGQDGAPLMERRLKQFEANRLLLSQLIDHGLKLSSAEKGGNTLARAEECRLAAATLAAALKAAPGDDPDRVAELGDHIAAVVRDGLVPNLTQAGQDIRPGSQDYERLKDLSRLSNEDVIAIVAAFPTGDRLERSSKVADARSRLADAGRKIIVIK
ncbi:MAG TPA: hypothetical protein VM533_13295 [Fimbriiglobus sp.]|nr:hypothetical protein [Fimbriiglobus sp.]